MAYHTTALVELLGHSERFACPGCGQPDGQLKAQPSP